MPHNEAALNSVSHKPIEESRGFSVIVTQGPSKQDGQCDARLAKRLVGVQFTMLLFKGSGILPRGCPRSFVWGTTSLLSSHLLLIRVLQNKAQDLSVHELLPIVIIKTQRSRLGRRKTIWRETRHIFSGAALSSGFPRSFPPTLQGSTSLQVSRRDEGSFALSVDSIQVTASLSFVCHFGSLFWKYIAIVPYTSSLHHPARDTWFVFIHTMPLTCC